MIALIAEGFGLGALKHHPGFTAIAAQFDHVDWAGGGFWDMIQPAFMFMVGVAMPFALARRIERGATFRQNLLHVAMRSLRLILLSQILICIAKNKLEFQLINVLSQIAFTYFLCFLIMQLPPRWQAIMAALILAVHSALFFLFPGPGGAFSRVNNVGAGIDRAILGYNYTGSYVTINFLTSTVTTLFGVWTGNLLRTAKSHVTKMKILLLAAAGCFASGLILALWVPLVKRLWTASWTLYSSGWALLMLIAFFWLIEIRHHRRIAFPLLVVGMNSIFIYSVHQVLHGWIDKSLAVFTARFSFIGTLAPVAQACAVLLVLWSLCYWLYRREIFFKL